MFKSVLQFTGLKTNIFLVNFPLCKYVALSWLVVVIETDLHGLPSHTQALVVTSMCEKSFPSKQIVGIKYNIYYYVVNIHFFIINDHSNCQI